MSGSFLRIKAASLTDLFLCLSSLFGVCKPIDIVHVTLFLLQIPLLLTILPFSALFRQRSKDIPVPFHFHRRDRQLRRCRDRRQRKLFDVMSGTRVESIDLEFGSGPAP